jgi:hypothetical protein
MFDRNSLCLQAISIKSPVGANPTRVSAAARMLIDASILEDISKCMAEVSSIITIVSALPGHEDNANLVEDARSAIDYEILSKLRSSRVKVNAAILLKLFVQSLKIHKAGNCFEFSLYGHTLLKGMGMNSQVMRIINGNHVFVVLNLDEDSKVNDHTTWNKGAIIADVFFNSIYVSEDIPELMKSLVFNDEDSTVKYEAFDPESQYFSNSVIEDLVEEWRAILQLQNSIMPVKSI